MSLTQEEIERLVAWQQGKLADAEASALSQKIDGDPVFRAEAEAYMEVLNGLEVLQYRDIKAQIAGYEQRLLREQTFQPQTESGRVLSMWPPILAIAAAITLLMLIGGGWWMGQNYSNDALMAEYYEAPVLMDPGSAGTRGGGDTRSAQQADGTRSTESQQISIQEQLLGMNTWEDSAKLLKSLAPDHQEYYMGQFLLGHGYLSKKEYTAAADIFGPLLDQPALEGQAYNLNLSYILASVGAGREDDPKVQELLTNVPPDALEFYKNRVESIRKTLSSKWRILASD